MAEYLAPAVYVEEVDTGAKPIEGVSTSTAGMVGVAERGPLDVPILVTSLGDYERWFGGRLPRRDFIDPLDPNRAHCYLPHAIQGFFTNGGKRAYVVRVAPVDADRATGFLYGGAAAGDAGTMLLRSAAQGGGVGVPIYVLDTNGIGDTDTIRIGDGSRAEYRVVDGAPGDERDVLPLSAPLNRSYHAGDPISVHAPAEPLTAPTQPYALDSAAAAGATSVSVASADDLTAVPVPFLIEIGSGGTLELHVVRAAPTGTDPYDIELVDPLVHDHPTGAVRIFETDADTDALETDLSAGGQIAFRVPGSPAPGAGAIVEFATASATGHEARRFAALASFPLDQPLPLDAPAGSRVSHIAAPADMAGPGAKALTAAASAGARVLTLDDRVDVEVGQPVRIGAVGSEEYGVVAAITGERGAAPDAGAITLALPLVLDHGSGAEVRVQDSVSAGTHGSSRTLFDAAAGAASIILLPGQAFAANDFVSIERPDGSVSLHQLGASIAFANIGSVTLDAVLERDHAAGEAVAEAHRLIQVDALDVGAWGNRLLISLEDEANGLATRTQATALNAPLELDVASLTGIEAGTLIELGNPNGGTVLLKVRRIDRTSRKVTLDAPGLDAAALATLGAFVLPLDVRSREFALTVRLRRRPDPAVPSRDSMIIATESFRHLSMDARHSRYFVKVIGDMNGPPRLEDRRPDGESQLIRVAEADLAADTAAIRAGPEALTDLLASGLTAPARHALRGGDDSIATIDDNVYLGLDDVEPLNRTGLHALKTIQNVSIVAVPGQGSAQLQAGLIAHCELMRYRFAVLDAELPDASLADVQQQRQSFDTKYAGLYYPWLTIPDPDPDTLTVIRDFALPPSGHMLGIYARTDEERGVHKAPANEVVRGITGLTRKLNKGEHDILNPSPVNINVIRDFRPDGRGIRAWGARCITSDSDYKYVPVRRLLIFVEQSIERGLQWVVFEPNSEMLWARVRRTIRNFLTDVWRSGALEGVKPEEAFFVKCDRTTMTQTDIDNGRLICVVGVAPVKPAEFVIVRIGLFTAHAEE
jgi:uncharacterized protein